MKELICYSNMFDLDQKVFIVDTETGEKEFVGSFQYPELKNKILQIAKEKNITDLRLFGDQEFNQALGENIETESKLNYSNSSLKVKYN